MTLADAAFIGMQWIQDMVELHRLRLTDEEMLKTIAANYHRSIAKAEQWIQEAQNGRVEQRDVAADTRRNCADDGVLPDSQSDGAVKRKHNRYCGMCDRLTPASEYECRLCGAETDKWD